MALQESRLGAQARKHGLVLIRTGGHIYHLWSDKNERYAIRSAALIDIKIYLDGQLKAQVQENTAKRIRRSVSESQSQFPPPLSDTSTKIRSARALLRTGRFVKM